MISIATWPRASSRALSRASKEVEAPSYRPTKSYFPRLEGYGFGVGFSEGFVLDRDTSVMLLTVDVAREEERFVADEAQPEREWTATATKTATVHALIKRMQPEYCMSITNPQTCGGMRFWSGKAASASSSNLSRSWWSCSLRAWLYSSDSSRNVSRVIRSRSSFEIDICTRTS